MQCVVLEMRVRGAAIERGLLRRSAGHRGFLEIVDTRENSYNRILKLAYLKDEAGTVIKTLYGVTLLYLNGDKLGLTGFECCMCDGALMDFAQTWTIKLGSSEAGRDNQGRMPRSENYRH